MLSGGQACHLFSTYSIKYVEKITKSFRTCVEFKPRVVRPKAGTVIKAIHLFELLN